MVGNHWQNRVLLGSKGLTGNHLEEGESVGMSTQKWNRLGFLCVRVPFIERHNIMLNEMLPNAFLPFWVDSLKSALLKSCLRICQVMKLSTECHYSSELLIPARVWYKSFGCNSIFLESLQLHFFFSSDPLNNFFSEEPLDLNKPMMYDRWYYSMHALKMKLKAGRPHLRNYPHTSTHIMLPIGILGVLNGS